MAIDPRACLPGEVFEGTVGGERWTPVPDYGGYYEVSDQGNVRSVDRTVVDRKGRHLRQSGKPLSPYLTRSGRKQVTLTGRDRSRSHFLIHRLVLTAFVGPCPDGHEACHWNDDPADNRLVNLRWGTRVENLQDQIRNGKQYNLNKTHCPDGHPYTPENTYVSPQGHRTCRICQAKYEKNYRERRRAA